MQDNDCLLIGVESRDIAERTVCDVEDGSKITCAVEVDVRHGGIELEVGREQRELYCRS